MPFDSDRARATGALATGEVPGPTPQGAPRRRPLAGAHVATELAGQDGPGRSHPAWRPPAPEGEEPGLRLDATRRHRPRE